MNTKQKLLICGAAACAALFLFSGFMLLREHHDGQQSAEAFESVAGLVREDSKQSAPDSETEEAPAPELTAFEKYAEVFAQNDDLIGWISIPGTRIDYPVMQTKDNPDYYLKHSFQKSVQQLRRSLCRRKLRRGYFRQHGALRPPHERWLYVLRPVQI